MKGYGARLNKFGSSFEIPFLLIAVLLIVGFLILVPSSWVSTCWATAPLTQPAMYSRVRVLESRFFFHEYEKDPLEKRLQRLELLVFGQTQNGSNEERLARLNKSIAEHDQQSALKTQQSAAPEKSSSLPEKAASASSQYPALNTIEWRVLKKTYTNEPLDTRLSQLETKVFGQPSPAMAYADRVERLNRTLGIGIASSGNPPQVVGPMPKATPRDYQPDINNLPFSMTPFVSPFNDDSPSFTYPSQVSELFRQMNEQMEEMMKMAQGAQPYLETPTTPHPNKQNPQKQSPSLPFVEKFYSEPQIPSYNDPNSI